MEDIIKNFVLPFLGILFGIWIMCQGLDACSMQKLNNDGFKIIKEYDTYVLVEKENHRYIATPSGMYGLEWNYEHYPNCQCLKNNKVNE